MLLCFLGKGFSLPEEYQRSGPKKGLLFSLYIYLPLFVIIGVIALKWNKLKKFWHREEPLSEGWVNTLIFKIMGRIWMQFRVL